MPVTSRKNIAEASFPRHFKSSSLQEGKTITAFANGGDIDARLKMLESSMLAGMAFANAGVTAVHTFAYPIGAGFHIPHGIANTIMLIPVLQFNLMGNLKQFADISRIFGGYASNIREITLAQRGLEALNGLEIPQHLSQYGVKAEDVPAGRGG